MPRSFGNNYWLTPATKKRIAGDPAVQEMLSVALKRITQLNRANPLLAQKFYRTTLANGDELVVRTQWGREYVYLYRPGEEEEELGCTLFLETGKQYALTWAPLAEASYRPAQIEFPDDFTALTTSFLGTLSADAKGELVFALPTTPVEVTCDDDPPAPPTAYTYDPWGVSSLSGITSTTLQDGESRVVTCPFCDRTEEAPV